MKRRRNSSKMLPNPEFDIVGPLIAIGIAKILADKYNNSASLTPDTSALQETIHSAVVPEPTTLAPASSDHPALATTSPPSGPAIQTPYPTFPMPTSAAQTVTPTEQVCVQYDLSKATPNSGLLPCLKYADAGTATPQLPAVPVQTFEVSKLNGLPSRGHPLGRVLAQRRY